MLRILEESRGLKEYSDDYGAGDLDGPPISFSRILGEGDDKAEFSVEVDVNDGDWEATGPLWALNYVPNGSENPASRPVSYTAGQKDERGVVSKITGTEFMNPGKRLEMLPASIRAAAIAWVDRKVEDAVRNYEEEEPDYEPDDYNPDPDGHGYWDSYWSTGPGRDR